MSNLLTYLVLGAVQGVVEWVPISSEGVVSLVSFLWAGVSEPVELALFLHSGTMLAVLLYFFNDFKKVILLKDKKMFRFLFITTTVSLLVGFPVFKLVENVAVGKYLLFLTGLALLVTAYFQKKKLNLGWSKDKIALLSGLLQGLSVIPGLSRSGSTIFGLSLGEMSSEEALKTSYMMSVPIVLASSIYLSLKNPVMVREGWVALAASFLVGIMTLHLLLKLSKKINFYQLALAFSILCFLSFFFLPL